MYQIVDGIQLTRKKRVCHVLNEQGGLMWTGRNAGEAIKWMLDNDITEASLDSDSESIELNFRLMPF